MNILPERERPRAMKFLLSWLADPDSRMDSVPGKSTAVVLRNWGGGPIHSVEH
jgi:hypothetical protein